MLGSIAPSRREVAVRIRAGKASIGRCSTRTPRVFRRVCWSVHRGPPSSREKRTLKGAFQGASRPTSAAPSVSRGTDPGLASNSIKAIRRYVSSREVLQKLKAAGWEIARVAGPHHQLAHPTRPGVITVPHPKKDLAVGLIKSIEKQSGVQLR